MDPLSDVLSLLRPRSYVTGGLTAGGRWSLRFPAPSGIKCYFMVKGECWLSVESREPIRIRAGNCVLLPHRQSFLLTSDPSLPPIDADVSYLSRRDYKGILSVSPGDDMFLLGSHFSLEGDARFLLDVLPPVVVLEPTQQPETLRWAVERILTEMRDPQPGGTLIAQQAAYFLLVEALRLHLAHDTSGSGWLFALTDRRLGAALSSIHEDPARNWSLKELAQSAGMSRTAFAQAFKAKVGETPIAYLARWRMTLAANRLQAHGEPISSIAPELGYQSESAFSAAFRRHWGTSPRAFTRARQP
ncbi:AraC family transcriptional regulator [Rhizobium binxianense]